MPYCQKCGAELDEDTEFCPNCGTAVGPPVSEPERRRARRPTSLLTIVLIVLIVIALVIVAIAFLPIHNVGPLTRRMSVPSESGVNVLNLNLTADVVGVSITFENLTGEWQSPSIILNASATARVGIFSSSDFLERYMPVWEDETEDNVLTVTVKQEVDTFFWPWHSLLNVTFDIRIDPSMNTSLNIKTGTGGIVLYTKAGVVLNSLNLEANTGRIEANVVEDTIVSGNISVRTTTGGVKLDWDNVVVVNHVEVNAVVTTGGADMKVRQHENLLENVTLNAETVTGGVDFTIDVKGDLGAKIQSAVTTGEIDIDRQVGFSGTETLLESNNYPSSYNFDVTLKTTTGGINIDAKSTP